MRLRSVLLAALAAASLVLSAGAAARARSHRTTCSIAGLSFSFAQGTAGIGDTVRGLSASGVSCAVARAVATTVTKALLYDTALPTRSRSLRVHVTAPCNGCAPVWQVTAASGSRRVSFSVYGG